MKSQKTSLNSRLGRTLALTLPGLTLLAFGLIGCGGSGSKPARPAVEAGLRLENQPRELRITAGRQVQLAARVIGRTDQGVLWATEAGHGTVSESGLYTAPLVPGSYTLVSRAKGAERVTDRTRVTVVAAPEVLEWRADVERVSPGGSANLMPRFRGGVAEVLPGVGAVVTDQAITVHPEATTEYLLRVTNELNDVAEARVTVTVAGADGAAPVVAPTDGGGSAPVMVAPAHGGGSAPVVVAPAPGGGSALVVAAPAPGGGSAPVAAAPALGGGSAPVAAPTLGGGSAPVVGGDSSLAAPQVILGDSNRVQVVAPRPGERYRFDIEGGGVRRWRNQPRGPFRRVRAVGWTLCLDLPAHQCHRRNLRRLAAHRLRGQAGSLSGAGPGVVPGRFPPGPG